MVIQVLQSEFCSKNGNQVEFSKDLPWILPELTCAIHTQTKAAVDRRSSAPRGEDIQDCQRHYESVVPNVHNIYNIMVMNVFKWLQCSYIHYTLYIIHYVYNFMWMHLASL